MHIRLLLFYIGVLLKSNNRFIRNISIPDKVDGWVGP